MTFLRHPSCSSGLIQDFLDLYTLEWQKAVSAFIARRVIRVPLCPDLLQLLVSRFL